ncbi:MAG: hypothetical protein C0603_09610 [Denitrovibrio sp.]|nr:MAG: hypothetical protein C0603_09610 [Denitrovibrio sp.]
MIEIKNLYFSYGADFSLNIEKLVIPDKGLVSIIGPNGSGKSTLLRILAGLNKKYSGSVTLDDEEYELFRHEDMASRVAYIPVYAWPDNPVTVRQLILSGAYRYGGEADISEIADRCGLSEMTEKSIYEISSGEMKRVLIARALVQKTPVIVMDEPFANLDPYYEVKIMELIREIAREKLIIAAVHNVTIASIISNCMAGIKNGKLEFILSETPSEEILKALYGTDFILVNGHPSPDYFSTTS